MFMNYYSTGSPTSHVETALLKGSRVEGDGGIIYRFRVSEERRD